MIQAANETLYRMSTFNKPEMTPLLSEKKLAVLLWVITGGQGADISQLTLLSSCSRAIQMHSDLFINIKEFLKKLKPEDASHYEHLMNNDRLMYCLVDELGFNNRTLDENKIPEYFTKAEKNLEEEIEDIKSSLKTEVEKLKSDLASEKVKREKALSTLQWKVQEAEQAKNNINELKSILDIEKQKVSTIENKDYSTANKHSHEAAEIIENNIKKIVTLFTKVIILLIAITAIYKLNNVESIEILDTTIGKSTINLTAYVISTCLTWFLPEYIFHPITEFISKKVISTLKKK